MFDFLRKFERAILGALILMLTLVVFLSVVQLGWILIQDIISPPCCHS